MNDISKIKNEENSNGKTSIKITGGDLYQYCADFGLMLSWGIPIMKVLEETGSQAGNPFFHRVSSLVGENILRGESIASTYCEFPQVFKPVFTKWVRIGERFGLLDEAFLKMAGIIRFENLLIPDNHQLSAVETGQFLLKASRILMEEENYRSEGDCYKISPETPGKLKNITGEGLLNEWLEQAEKSETVSLFNISMWEFLTGSIHKRIANASFWHIMGTAEIGGYLPEMAEILGLYLTDKNNLLPDTGIFKTDFQHKEPEKSLIGIAARILDKIEEEGTGAIKIKGRIYTLILGENETPLPEITGTPPDDTNELIAVVSRLKMMLDLDPAERRIAQTVRKEMLIRGKNRIVQVKTTPPFSFPPQRQEAGLQQEEEKPEIIEINIEEASYDK